MNKKAIDFLLVLTPAILFIIIWELSVMNSSNLKFLFASPSLILDKAIIEYQNIGIWKDINITAFEAISGLLIGTILGTITAILLWFSPLAQKISKPYITFFGSIPIFALAPMLIIWFGVGITAKVVIASTGVFLVSLVQTFSGINSTAKQHLDFAKIIKANKKQIILNILMPSAKQWLITGIKINIGVAILGAFIGEFISSQAGLGHYIISAGQIYDIPGALFGIINLSILAIIMEKLIKKIL